MFDTIEEIDAELEKIRKRKQEAQDMIDMDTWGGLLRGSTKKAAVMQRERELLEKREKLIQSGGHIDYGTRIEAVASAVSYLEEALVKEYPDLVDSCKKMEKELEKIRVSIDS